MERFYRPESVMLSHLLSFPPHNCVWGTPPSFQRLRIQKIKVASLKLSQFLAEQAGATAPKSVPESGGLCWVIQGEWAVRCRGGGVSA